MKVTIKKKTVEIKFHYACLHYLARLWNLKGITAIPMHLQTGNVDDIEGTAEMLYAAIQTSGIDSPEVITLEDVGNHVLATPGIVQETILAFNESYPVPTDDVGKRKAAKANLK